MKTINLILIIYQSFYFSFIFLFLFSVKTASENSFDKFFKKTIVKKTAKFIQLNILTDL